MALLQVHHRVLFPAAGMLEMALAGASSALQPYTSNRLGLSGASIAAPLILSTAPGARRPMVACLLRPGTGTVAVESRPSSAVPDSAWQHHMAASAARLPAVAGGPKARPLSLQQRMFDAFVRSATGVLAEAGLLPGAGSAAGALAPALPVATGQVQGAELLLGQQPEGYLLHPALLDAATHTAAALQASQRAEAGVSRIPVAVGALAAGEGAGAAPLRAACQWCKGVFGGMLANGTAVTSFGLAASGSTTAHLTDLQAKPVAAAALRAGLAAAQPVQQRPSVVRAAAQGPPAKQAVAVQRAVPVVDSSAIQARVLRIVSTMLGGAEVAPDQPLMEAGLDSLGEQGTAARCTACPLGLASHTLPNLNNKH